MPLITDIAPLAKLLDTSVQILHRGDPAPAEHTQKDWAEAGRAVFEISDELFSVFENTEPPSKSDLEITVAYITFSPAAKRVFTSRFLGRSEPFVDGFYVGSMANDKTRTGIVSVLAYPDRYEYSLAYLEDADLNSKEHSAFFYRILLNMHAYLTTLRPDIERAAYLTPKERTAANVSKKAEQRLKKAARERCNYSRVGHRRPLIQPEIIEARGQSEEAIRRHVVRAHWRMQAYGEGMRQRRATWIAAHWRGAGGQAAPNVRECLVPEV